MIKAKVKEEVYDVEVVSSSEVIFNGEKRELDIISVSEDKLHVRIIEKGGGAAWYQVFTSSTNVTII